MIELTEQQRHELIVPEPVAIDPQTRETYVLVRREVYERFKTLLALTPGEEVLLTRGDKPVARIVAGPGEKPRPVPGRGKGMLTVISEDDDHLNDFIEYMP